MHSAYSGLSHGLSALWTPAPHVLVQWDQDDQTPHSPWIASGVFPTVMHSPEKHHWGEKRKHKELQIIITGKRSCELFVTSAHDGWTLKWKCKWRCHRTPLHSTMAELLMAPLCPLGQHSLQTAWFTVTLFSPHRVPSAAASSLERQEPFTEHHSVWQRFWKRKKPAAVCGRAELLWPSFSKTSHSFVLPLKKPCKDCISREVRVFYKIGTTKNPNLGTCHYCAKRDYLKNKK